MTQGPNTTPTHRYTAALACDIETRWQAAWETEGAFRQPNPGEPGFDAAKPKFYCLDMFPYPSGAGLHVGHPEGYTATDIICRYRRMKGFNVLHPMGWDAFGLPAEQYAIQTGVHPAKTTRTAIDNFRRQLKRFGFSYDWSREFGTIDETYYGWTQWVFLRLYNAWFDEKAKKARPVSELEALAARGEVETPKPWGEMTVGERRAFVDSRRLAYQSEMVVNWCPKLGTVLANDEVIDGRSERGGHPVVRKPLKQWVFRITAYAQRLLEQLEWLDWPASTKAMQSEWIGKSEGAEIEFLGSPTLRVGPGASLRNAIDANPDIAAFPVGFVPRNPYPDGMYGAVADLIVKRRNLPHYQLPDATYFVTWGVTPGDTLSETERDEVVKALTHFDGQRCRTYAACVMPDHVHWIVRPYEGVDLLRLCESVKHFCATQINKVRHRTGRLWDPEAFDHIIRNAKDFSEFVTYVVRNPKEAGLVQDVGTYRWSVVHPDVVGTPPHAERGATQDLRVFTTRPDTIFGATFMVVAPEHPLVAGALASPTPETDVAALRAYVERTKARSDIERQEAKAKTGVFTGVYVSNPATSHAIPVWTADYVLMGYGTGAIMAVPAHDQRDFEFAKAFGLPIRDVVYPRAVLAMRHFALHAYAGEPAAAWRDHFAEFMSLVAASGEKVEEFEKWLRIAVTAASPDEKGRAASHAAWLETLDTLGVASFADLRRRFEDGSYYAAHGEAFDGAGLAVNSANPEVSLDGLDKSEAVTTITAWLDRTGRGTGKVNFRLRDWVFSRQRYWGEPFPIVYDDAGNAYPILESHLPLTLPELADYAPVESDTPQPLLAKAGPWVNTTAGEAGVDPAVLPPSTPVRRETNTMPGSAGSSWYAIRYCDPKNATRFVGREAETYWMGSLGMGGTGLVAVATVPPVSNTKDFQHRRDACATQTQSQGQGSVGGVDLYMGGSEHAVGHLLYARFWQNVLFDLGEVSTPEPFKRLFHQGLITSFAYQDAGKHLVPVDEVDEVTEGKFVRRSTGEAVTQIVAKMSKSLKNVVNPDDVIAEFGADTFRLYEMYMGPLEASKPWNPRDITGLHRFLQRAWRLTVSEETGTLKAAANADEKLDKLLHRLIAKVGTDIDRLSFNTAIAAMIEFVNAGVATDKGTGALTTEQVRRLALVLSPFAPHLAEELWAKSGGQGLAMRQPWPSVDETKLKDDTLEVPVQVGGKVRSRVMVPAGADVKLHEEIALADAKVVESIGGKTIRKVIVVPGKMVNVVV